MHQAQAYIRDALLPSTPSFSKFDSYVLSPSESSQLLKRLKGDAVSYTYSATVSIGEAISGAEKGLFTWTTVKLYYSIFYAFRALLALNDVCIFYIAKKPYCIEVKPGQTGVSRG